MIQEETNLVVADNSGAKKIRCIRVLGGHDKRYASLGDLIQMHAVEGGSGVCRDIDRAHEIHGHVFLDVPTADGEHEQRIPSVDARALQPLREGALPSVVVDARGELGDVVGRRVRLEMADLAEVVDRVARVTRGAADTEDEETAAGIACGGEGEGKTIDGIRIDAADCLDALVEIRATE